MSQILCSDIHRTYTVTVIFETARAGIVPICRFLAVATTRAGLRRIRLVNLHNRNTEHFGFVGYQGGDFTKRPLVKFLIRTFSVVNVIANTREVAKHNRANIFEVAILQKLCGMLVEGIFDLVINLLDTFPLAACEFPPPSRMAFTFTKIARLNSESTLFLCR